MSHERTGRAFLFDLEWISRPESLAVLLEKYKPVLVTPALNPENVGGIGVDEFKALVKSCQPTPEWLNRVYECESMAKKPRTTIFGAIADSLKALENPLPEKLNRLAETVTPIVMCYRTVGPDGDMSDIKTSLGQENIVKDFWELCAGAEPCGWSIEGGDLPVILSTTARLRREQPERRLEFTPTSSISILRFTGYCDLMKVRFGKSQQAAKLDDVALASGWVPTNVDPLKDGSEVAEAYEEGRIQNIIDHCIQDIEKLSWVYELYSGVIGGI